MSRPTQYLNDCPVPYLTASQPSNGDIVQVALAREYSIESCNADKAALRAWFDVYAGKKRHWWSRKE